MSGDDHRSPFDVLVADGDPGDAALIARALGAYRPEARVATARDVAEALALLDGACPRLVLLDLDLPAPGGLEVLRRLRARGAPVGPPVVMLTASRDEARLVESYALGASSYIVKPRGVGALASAVRELAFYWLVLNQRPLP